MKPWRIKQWCIPPESNAEFVWKMEDVLEVYSRARDPKHPVVCMDETSKQQIQEVRKPFAVKPGRPYRYDSEYKRNGVSNLFMFFAPMEGWRHVAVTDRRTRTDWAQAIKTLVDKHFPEADKITLVMDNLNTHSPSSLYGTFPPDEAKRILDRLEIHYTPKHGSWLNMAEIELSVLGRQCLAGRIPDQHTLRHEVDQWQEQRNQKCAQTDWRFTTDNARVKLKRLYPSLDV